MNRVRVLLDTGPSAAEVRRIERAFAEVGMEAVAEGHSYGGPPPTSAFLIVVNACLSPFLAAFAAGPGAPGLAGVVQTLLDMRADERTWGKRHGVRLEDSRTGLAVALPPGVPPAAYEALLEADLGDLDRATPAALLDWDALLGRWSARLTTAVEPISRRLPVRRRVGGPAIRQLSEAELGRLWRLVSRPPGSAVTWQRAKVVMLAATGWNAASISQRVLMSERRVRAVIANFNRDGFDSLAPGYDRGDPVEPSVEEEREALRVLARPPAEFGLDQPEWTRGALTQLLVSNGVVEDADPALIASLIRPAIPPRKRRDRAAPEHRGDQAGPGFRGGPMTQTPTVQDILQTLLENEHQARRTLNLVPSENAMSGLAKLPLLLDTYHRYFFNEELSDERWHFRGAALAADVETAVTLPLLRELADAPHVSVRPLSGLNAMTVVLAALGGPPGSTVVTVDQGNGGHYATPDIAGRLGQRVATIGGPDPHTIDYRAAARLVAERRPGLIYVDQSNCLFPLDVAELVRHVREVDEDVVVHVDVSHWMGLVLGRAFPNPLDCGADSFGGSTHKTFPGPQKAVFCTRRDDLAERFGQAQDYLISSHHFGATLSLGLALVEFRDFGGPGYARAVLDNTRRFARNLHERGLPVEAAGRGFTAGHQIWLDTQAVGLPARVAADRLYAAGLRVNFQDLPGIAHQALRVGLNEPTYRGLRGGDMDELAGIFADAVRAERSPGELAARTARLRAARRSSPAFPVESDPLAETALRLCLGALLDRSPTDVGAALDSLTGAGVPALAD
ncbi:helix-turn-helix domain-containing protein [Nonomuraea sediminis]|uniref:helix-turn-helix domain-containing protein n=1 Tax=Nonomuraea sediminis TaxID=2835864 RepID=UPI001BDD7AF6|nr:helix-turn-helix domain-containing protein [Nonomuraea sediminis]